MLYNHITEDKNYNMFIQDIQDFSFYL